MKKSLLVVWDYWKKIGIMIGNVISFMVLTIFYFTIFALFVIPLRIFGKNPLLTQSEKSNWIEKKNISFISLSNFEKEF